MVDVAEVLDKFGIPWPDADTDKAREAADAWKALGTAAQSALDEGNHASDILCANNTGKAMAAFSDYWDKFGGNDKAAYLRVLVDCCNAMATSCDKFADAVDDAKHKLEEKAAEIAGAIGGGIVLTLFTAGLSDAIGDSAAAALVSAALADVDALGTAITGVVSTVISGTVMGLLDAAMAQLAKNLARLGFGEKPEWSGTDFAVGAFAGILGTTATGLASGGSAAAGAVSDDVAAITPELPRLVNSIPDAVNTPAGKALIDIASKNTAQDVANASQGKPLEGPSAEEVIGGLLDAKIEAAGESEG